MDKWNLGDWSIKLSLNRADEEDWSKQRNRGESPIVKHAPLHLSKQCVMSRGRCTTGVHFNRPRVGLVPPLNAGIYYRFRVWSGGLTGMRSYSCSLLLGPEVWSFGSTVGGGCRYQNLCDLLAFAEYCSTFPCPPLLVVCFVQFLNLFANSAMFVLLGLNLCQLLNVVARRGFLFLNAKSAIGSAFPLMLDRQLIDCCLLSARVSVCLLFFIEFFRFVCNSFNFYSDNAIFVEKILIFLFFAGTGFHGGCSHWFQGSRFLSGDALQPLHFSTSALLGDLW